MWPAVALSRTLSRKRCLEMLLTGDMINAQVAKEWGLVNKVVPAEKLEDAVEVVDAFLNKRKPIWKMK